MNSPVNLADNLWLADGPVVRWLTMPFPTRMVICRLGGGDLFIHSPVALTSRLHDFVENVGNPRYLVSPNKLHHLFIPQWQEAFPDALCFAPPGLAAKRADLRFAGNLSDEPEPVWEREIDQVVFSGSRLVDEVVFFHKASRTLILGDLVQNHDPTTLAWPHRLLARLGGMLAPKGRTPLDFRLSFYGRRDLARKAFEKIRQWKPQAVIMCHGLPVLDDADHFLEQAFAWLAAPRPTPAG